MLSFVFSVFTITLIVFKSLKDRKFTIHLFLFQLASANNVLQYTVFSQHMPLFPILAGYCEGFLAEYFGIWSHYLIGFLIASIKFQVSSLALCFYIKHQSIAKVLIHNVLSDKVYYIGLLFYVTHPIISFLLFCGGGMEKEEQLTFIQQYYPEYLNEFSKLHNFAIYKFNIWFILLLVETLLVGAFCGAVFIFITFDMIRMLKKLPTKVSTNSFKRYQATVISLLAQFAASVVLLVQLLSFVSIVIIGFERAQEIVVFILLICSLHSIINSIVLIATTPHYRDSIFRYVKELETI
ncbi:unnamed protein product [Caenorhabditis brenneri]